jgi:hypothetical protein
MLSVAMARKNMDNEPKSIMLSTKGKKDLIAHGLA